MHRVGRPLLMESEIKNARSYPEASLVRDDRLQDCGDYKPTTQCITEQRTEEQNHALDAALRQLNRRSQDQHGRDAAAGLPDHQVIAILRSQTFCRTQALQDSINTAVRLLCTLPDVHANLTDDLFPVRNRHV